MTAGLLLIGNGTDAMRRRYEPGFTVHQLEKIEDTEGFLAEHGPSIRGISTSGGDGIPEGLLARLPNVEVISNYGVGYDKVPVAECLERGITVSHTPDVLNAEVANTAIMLMLAASRNLVADDRYLREGRWEAEGAPPLSRGVDGRTVGILGLGRIGETIARKLEAFDAEVIYHTRTEKPGKPWRYYGNLVEMARAADVLIVITPGGASTHHLVNAEVLEALGPEGILVNVARGTVVDEAALIAALQAGKLGRAGLDVFENEPKVPAELIAMDNVVLLPHVGSATAETREAMAALTVENIEQYFRDGTVRTPIPECRKD